MCNVVDFSNVENGKELFFDKCAARGYAYDRALRIWDWIVDRRKEAERNKTRERIRKMMSISYPPRMMYETDVAYHVRCVQFLKHGNRQEQFA